MVERSRVTAVVMTKEPRAGEVKTRLVAGGLCDASTAAALAEAMLRCTIHRLQECFHVVLAASPDGSAARIAHRLGLNGLDLLDQGAGTLGERLDRVWRNLSRTDPVAFFGIDSPDIPADLLRLIPVAIEDQAIVLGPTLDGGYWALAAREHRPQVLREIDWGTRRVYDQTCRRAREAGLTVRALTPWPDVDEPGDVVELRRRLASLPPEEAEESALGELAEALDRLLTRRGSAGKRP